MMNSFAQERIAVIDIGSNSVRLVIYDQLKRVPIPLFNEKVLCGLARHLEKTGKLHPEGVVLAHKTLSRFVHIARAMQVKKLEIFATAAVREAQDGKAFVEFFCQQHHVNVSIFSGEKEAEYAGLGILACMPDAEGVVGDLGGGSLELAQIHANKVDLFHSYPIGLLRLLNASEGDRAKAAHLIDSYLAHVAFFSHANQQCFYAVGGGFRNLAKIHIALTHYPLRILHHYTVSCHTFRPLLRHIAEMPPADLQQMPDISGRRTDTLPLTALLLERIIEKMDAKAVVFSAYGIREGFLFSHLTQQEQQKDPLLSGCADLIQQIGETASYGNELLEWMDPLFPDEPSTRRRLRLAACILSGLARYEHTEYRAEIAFRRFLDSSITGIEHSERLFIARALFHRYSTVNDKTITGITAPFLDTEEIHMAKTIGLAMRLAHNITAGTTGILPFTQIHKAENTLVLSFAPPGAPFMGEAVQKRFEKLASFLRLKAVIRGA